MVKFKKLIFLRKLFINLNNISICILLKYCKNYNKNTFYDFFIFYFLFFKFCCKIVANFSKSLYYTSQFSGSCINTIDYNRSIPQPLAAIKELKVLTRLNICRYSYGFYIHVFPVRAELAAFILRNSGPWENVSYKHFYFAFFKRFYNKDILFNSIKDIFMPFVFSLFKNPRPLRRLYVYTFSSQIESLVYFPYYFSYIFGVESPLRFLTKINTYYLTEGFPFEDILGSIQGPKSVLPNYPKKPFMGLYLKFYGQFLKLLPYSLGKPRELYFLYNYLRYNVVYRYSFKPVFGFYPKKPFYYNRAFFIKGDNQVYLPKNLDFLPSSGFLLKNFWVKKPGLTFLYQLDFNLKPGYFFNILFLISYSLRFLTLYKNLLILAGKLPGFAEKRERTISFSKFN